MKADWQSDGEAAPVAESSDWSSFFFFFSLPFILLSLCSLVSTIHPATMNNAQDFFNIQTFQGKLLTESVFDKSRT